MTNVSETHQIESEARKRLLMSGSETVDDMLGRLSMTCTTDEIIVIPQGDSIPPVTISRRRVMKAEASDERHTQTTDSVKETSYDNRTSDVREKTESESVSVTDKVDIKAELIISIVLVVAIVMAVITIKHIF